MELRQLDIFRILASELNFTRTAKRVHCVQSNVSVQIGAMEQELGVQLFERLGQQVRLTAHGSRLLPYAEHILRLLEEAHAITRCGGAPAGTLVIGSAESVLAYRLPPVIRIFRAKYPQVELVFRSIGSAELIPRLKGGELDLGLVIDDAWNDSRLQVETLCPEPVVLVAQPRHPLLTRSAVCAEDLRTQTFLLTDSRCAYRSKLERALAESNVRPKAIMEFTSVETIKQCATLGMGVACLPKIVVNPELTAGKLVVLPWTGSELTMKTLVAWHEHKWLSPAMEAFLSLLRLRLTANNATTKTNGGSLPHTHQTRARQRA